MDNKKGNAGKKRSPDSDEGIGSSIDSDSSSSETKEFTCIGYSGFLFPHSYSGDGLGATHIGLHLSTHAEKEARYKCLESQIRQQLTKIKRQFLIGQRPFDSRLYLDISRSFKSPKSSPVVCLNVLPYTDENASFYERVRAFSGRCAVILRSPGLICL
jgi:hypothetical protein